MKLRGITQATCLCTCNTIISVDTLMHTLRSTPWLYGATAACIRTKNVTLANKYFHLSKTKSVFIQQKYPVKGHMQLKCDSMYSTIERKIKSDIFTPREYVMVLEKARCRPAPYKVKQADHSQVQKQNDGYISSIRPGRVSAEARVANIKALLCEPEAILCKLDFQDEWKILRQRLNASKEITWHPMFPSRIPAKESKYRDLQSMKGVMPQCEHSFFDNLPHAPQGAHASTEESGWICTECSWLLLDMNCKLFLIATSITE